MSKTGMQCAKEMAVPDQKQRGQMEDLVTRHQSGVMPGVDPAQALHRQAHAWQCLARPTTAGTALAREHQQRNSREIEQETISIQIGQFQLRRYTELTDISLPAFKVGVHA